MSEWNEQTPVGLDPLTRVEYQLNGEERSRIGRVGELDWSDREADDGLGRIWRWRPVQGVGDVTSDAKGSGARFNADKPDLSLIPARIIARAATWTRDQRPASSLPPWPAVLRLLDDFQMAGDPGGYSLLAALREMDDDGQMWAECARVFTYGKAKYAAWNWAKGMAWSIPLACAMRHIVFGPLIGEEIDSESGETHRGHVACNIVMLLWYVDEFPEGNDLYVPAA
jgi:hypothetical protein